MPYNSILKLPAVGETARIYLHLHHKEDIMQLYGFSESRERSLFLDLLKVAGIGPKQAVRMLSGTEVDLFIKQLDDNDVDALTRLPGLGKKTAQKIILALRGKLSFEEETMQPQADSDIINALVDMGFDRKKAETAVRKAVEEISPEGIPEAEKEKAVFRRAIILLSS
jgi:Holliday junction DNA helicase RuvA